MRVRPRRLRECWALRENSDVVRVLGNALRGESVKPCFGSWHPGHRNCARCEDEDECYAAFDKVYGHAWLKNAKPPKEKPL